MLDQVVAVFLATIPTYRSAGQAFPLESPSSHASGPVWDWAWECMAQWARCWAGLMEEK